MPIRNGVLSAPSNAFDAFAWGARSVRAIQSSRLRPPLNPLACGRISLALLRYGFNPAIGYAGGAARHPQDTALIDESGQTVSFQRAEDLTRNGTAGLRDLGIGPGSTVAVLGRNSIGMALAIPAVSRTGADLVYLNTGFRTAQIAQTLSDRGVQLTLVDTELAALMPKGVTYQLLDEPATWSSGGMPTHRNSAGRHIILTSGTTGRPKGADRSHTPIESAISLLNALPYRQGATHVMAAPMFHSWGWLNHRLPGLLDATEIMIAKPTSDAVLDAAAEHAAEIIVTTPVVVRRLAETGPGSRDLSKLRGVLVSGSTIPADVVTSFQAQFGKVLYNLYGSTEVGFATCAGPADLTDTPNTAGRALDGVEVSILTPGGIPAPASQEGEIWVGSAAGFHGYIDGGDKDRRANLLSTGDLGHLNEHGLLFVSGRMDDLIVSGGENVHPAEVENVLRQHPAIHDVAVVGRPDPTYGQAVVAYLVLSESARSPEMSLAEVERYATDHLAAYQRPREFHTRSELPINDTGKVARRLL